MGRADRDRGKADRRRSRQVRRRQPASGEGRNVHRHPLRDLPPQEITAMPEIQFREALRQAMTEEMERDENVLLMGEEVAQYNGAYKVSEGMLAKFGPRRVFDTPISEAGFCGLGIGA